MTQLHSSGVGASESAGSGLADARFAFDIADLRVLFGKSEPERRQDIRDQLASMIDIVKRVNRVNIDHKQNYSLGSSETVLTAEHEGKKLVLSSSQLSGGQLIAYRAHLSAGPYAHLSIEGYRYSSDWQKEEIGVFLQPLYNDLLSKYQGTKIEKVDPLERLAGAVQRMQNRNKGG